MRRKRFQRGSIRARKHGRVKVWVAQWREGGEPRTKVLGPCADVTKGQAETMLAQILQPINAEAGRPSIPAFTFKQYVEHTYLPAARNRWKESTRSTSEPDIMRYLVPEFGDQPMKGMTRDQMQNSLAAMAGRLNTSVVAHLRWHLNAIFRMAMSDGVVPFNPAEALYIPAGKQSEMKRAMSKEEVKLALTVLDLRQRLILRLAVFDGMRPGEIFAIRLGKIGENQVLVDLRVYDGKLDTPKGRKGKNTSRRVALSPGTTVDMKAWTSFLSDRSPEAFLFPSETGKTPLRADNLWKRHFYPRLETVKLDWVNFQVFRRTNASLSRKANVDDKVSADQRGHGLGVSLGVYAISDLDQKLDAVRRLEAEVLGVAETADLALTQ